jgi:hypothetical protein
MILLFFKKVKLDIAYMDKRSYMIELDKTKKHQMGIGRLSRFIEKHLYDTDWYLIATCCGVTNILNDHERVTRAQSWHDDDYPTAISKFLIDVYNNDESTCLFLIKEIISQNTLNEDAKRELNEILKYFSTEESNISDYTYHFKFFESEQLILVPNYPDIFYKKLIEEINFQYITKHSMSLSVLMRKLFENLIIDILRKKYGTQGLQKYYDTSKGRFHDFSLLIKNLNLSISDFHPISPNLDQKFIGELNKYRETGNSGAHSIDVNLTVEDFSVNKKDINLTLSHFLFTSTTKYNSIHINLRP